MAEEVTSTLKLTAGDGITLVKGIDADAGKLIINATNDSNTKIYYHTFEDNNYLGLQISDADCAEIFAEAAEENAAILIKIVSTGSPYGSGDALYVYDGKYTPGAGMESYNELGFANSYIDASDSSVHTLELKIRRTGTEGSYSYSYQTLVGATGSGSSCPTTVYKLVFNTSAGKYVFDNLPAYDIVDKANSSGNVIIYLVNPAGSGDYVFYQKRFWSSSGNQGVEFRTVDNSAKLEVYRTAGTSTWTWEFINSNSTHTDKADLALNICRVSADQNDYFVDFPTNANQVSNFEGLYVAGGTGGPSGGGATYALFICNSESYTNSTSDSRTYTRTFVRVNSANNSTIDSLTATWTVTNDVYSAVTWTKSF